MPHKKFNIGDVVRVCKITDLQRRVNFSLAWKEKRVLGVTGVVWKYPADEGNELEHIPENLCLVIPDGVLFPNHDDNSREAIFFAEEELEHIVPENELIASKLLSWIDNV